MEGKKQSGEDAGDRWREHTLAWNPALTPGEHAEGTEGPGSVWFLGLNQNMEIIRQIWTLLNNTATFKCISPSFVEEICSSFSLNTVVVPVL